MTKAKSKKNPVRSKKSSTKISTQEQKPIELSLVKETQARVRVSQEDFIRRLSEKLTHFDARMILDAAMLSAGVERSEGFFRKDETKDICLQLIKRGGPAFSVGAGIYREVVG